MTITQSRLLQLISYDAATGQLRWRENRAPDIKAGDVAGTVRPDGYIAVRIDGRKYQAHRLAWLYEHGSLPPILDHINGNKGDNRIANLRPATNAQNCQNRGRRADNESGLKGVSFDKATGKWRANGGANGKWKSLGRFPTAEAAAAAYSAFVESNHGEFKYQGSQK